MSESELTHRLRALLIAPALDANDVGEARSSFEWVSRLSERCDVTVLTYRVKKSQSVRGKMSAAEFIEWNDLPLVGRFERLNAALKPGYAAFYLRARRWIRGALRSGRRFDLAHQIGPLAMRYPCPAAGLIDPFIVGPLAGSLDTPASFASEFASEPWYVRLRGLDTARFRHDSLLRGTYRRAGLVLGAAPYVRELLVVSGITPRRFEIMSETGVYSLPVVEHRGSAPKGQLRLLFVGRVVRSKGLRDAVRAIARLKDLPGVTLDAVGDGPDLAACRSEAQRLGVDDRVRFHGRVPRARVDEFYADADAFVFPSFREPSGNVVYEAMSYALPCVVADRGGPTHTVDDSCGFRVPLGGAPEAFAEGLSGAIRSLAADPALCRRMGAAARARVERIGDWDTKVDQMMEWYRSLACADTPARAEQRV